jgi:hypothetical protein
MENTLELVGELFTEYMFLVAVVLLGIVAGANYLWARSRRRRLAGLQPQPIVELVQGGEAVVRGVVRPLEQLEAPVTGAPAVAYTVKVKSAAREDGVRFALGISGAASEWDMAREPDKATLQGVTDFYVEDHTGRVMVCTKEPGVRVVVHWPPNRRERVRELGMPSEAMRQALEREGVDVPAFFSQPLVRGAERRLEAGDRVKVRARVMEPGRLGPMDYGTIEIIPE